MILISLSLLINYNPQKALGEYINLGGNGQEIVNNLKEIGELNDKFNCGLISNEAFWKRFKELAKNESKESLKGLWNGGYNTEELERLKDRTVEVIQWLGDNDVKILAYTNEENVRYLREKLPQFFESLEEKNLIVYSYSFLDVHNKEEFTRHGLDFCSKQDGSKLEYIIAWGEQSVEKTHSVEKEGVVLHYVKELETAYLNIIMSHPLFTKRKETVLGVRGTPQTMFSTQKTSEKGSDLALESEKPKL